MVYGHDVPLVFCPRKVQNSVLKLANRPQIICILAEKILRQLSNTA
jgi:hypothetical protein